MEKMHHAVILVGSGEAVRERARRLAAQTLCESAGERPCGVCPHCRKVLRGIHPDVTCVERAVDRQGKQRREITVDQIRELAVDAAVLPNEAAGKVYIFPEAETMNVPAQNAFLKLLEEPPAWVSFVLCAENPEQLLETVRSRCSLIRTAHREARDPRTEERARGFLEARGDRCELLRCCLAMEKLDAQALLEVIRSAMELAVREKLAPEELLALEDFLARGEGYLLSNVGVKHVTGYLATYGG